MSVAGGSVFSDTAASSSPLLSLLRSNYSPGTALSTKFTLTIYWNVREKEEKKKGRIWLAPGDRFRVEIDNETFVCDGGTFRHFSAGTNQLVVRRLADVDSSTLPSQIFAKYVASFPFSEVERKKGTAVFAWRCDSGETRYREIRITADEKGRRITRCVCTDHNGNTFTYDFKATVFGGKQPKERFEFDAPEDARVVDMRQ
jgi:outer membrane lipoprotein-sorting protein